MLLLFVRGYAFIDEPVTGANYASYLFDIIPNIIIFVIGCSPPIRWYSYLFRKLPLAFEPNFLNLICYCSDIFILLFEF